MTLLSDADGTVAGMFDAKMPREDAGFPVPFGILTPEDREDRDRYITVVDKSLGTFVETGESLKALRDRKLYLETHTTFEAFCHEQWSMTDRRARQLIAASGVIGNLLNSETGTIVPENYLESQIRPLCGLDPDQQREAFRRAVKTAPNGKLTAAHVESIARQYREPDPAPESKDWKLDDAIEYLGATMYDISRRWPPQYLGAMAGQLRSLADELTKYGELRP